MGNHQLGRQVMQVAEVLWNRRHLTNETALQILDIAADGIRGTDADFDAETEDWREILAEAFPAHPLAWYKEHDENGDLWYDNVYMRFYKRYQSTGKE